MTTLTRNNSRGWSRIGYWFVPIMSRFIILTRQYPLLDVVRIRVCSCIEDFLTLPSLNRVATAADAMRVSRKLDAMFIRYGERRVGRRDDTTLMSSLLPTRLSLDVG